MVPERSKVFTLPFGVGMAVVCGLVFLPGISGFYGIAAGALFAWLYNLTTRMTGGLGVELQARVGCGDAGTASFESNPARAGD